jgi:hypothetical protein
MSSRRAVSSGGSCTELAGRQLQIQPPAAAELADQHTRRAASTAIDCAPLDGG